MNHRYGAIETYIVCAWASGGKSSGLRFRSRFDFNDIDGGGLSGTTHGVCKCSAECCACTCLFTDAVLGVCVANPHVAGAILIIGRLRQEYVEFREDRIPSFANSRGWIRLDVGWKGLYKC